MNSPLIPWIRSLTPSSNASNSIHATGRLNSKLNESQFSSGQQHFRFLHIFDRFGTGKYKVFVSWATREVRCDSCKDWACPLKKWRSTLAVNVKKRRWKAFNCSSMLCDDQKVQLSNVKYFVKVPNGIHIRARAPGPQMVEHLIATKYATLAWWKDGRLPGGNSQSHHGVSSKIFYRLVFKATILDNQRWVCSLCKALSSTLSPRWLPHFDELLHQQYLRFLQRLLCPVVRNLLWLPCRLQGIFYNM